LIETRGIGVRLARAAFYELTGGNPDRLATPSGKTEPVILAETLRANGIEPTEEHQRRYARLLPEVYQRHRDQSGPERHQHRGPHGPPRRRAEAEHVLRRLAGFHLTVAKPRGTLGYTGST
jgi:hypothetical protein